MSRSTRSGLRSPHTGPQSTSASEDISLYAKAGHYLLQQVVASASSWLRNHTNSSILVLTTALLLTV